MWESLWAADVKEYAELVTLLWMLPERKKEQEERKQKSNQSKTAIRTKPKNAQQTEKKK